MAIISLTKYFSLSIIVACTAIFVAVIYCWNIETFSLKLFVPSVIFFSLIPEPSTPSKIVVRWGRSCDP